ncbi:MAG: rRNA maturation RNase YbeY [Candidatus Marinimicrobia bacterium]|nr:rRNA maturation RNase YbeY [Candidatus Neomarinimicrobiota bacterium]
MPTINITNLTSKFKINGKIAEELILSVLMAEKYDAKEISLILADDEYVNRLKLQYFDEDVYTDTITFNLNDEEEAVEGEMYLSADSISQNAQELNIKLDRECANVIIHSVLHLLGYEDDNPEQQQIMFDLQEKYLDQFDYDGILTREV